MNYANTKTIIAQLEAAFVEVDAKILENNKTWILERKAAVSEFMKSREARSMRKDQAALYDKIFELAGGKGIYNMFNGRSDEDAVEKITKNCEAIAEKRNVMIAKKLDKLEITEASELILAKMDELGSFTGTFQVNTNKGMKTLTIEQILAGGYNIQRLHARTLVKVK